MSSTARHEGAAAFGLPLALAAVLTLVLIAFGVPAVKASPHEVPIGVAGPTAAASQIGQALESRGPGAFEITSFSDEAALTQAIRDREVYGGFAMTPSGPAVLTASAGSPAVAQALAVIGTAMAQQQNTSAQVRDVVPLPKDDPRGAGIVASLLPLIAGAVAPALALSRRSRRRTTQIVGMLLSAAASGFAFAAVLHYWLGTLTGSYLAESAVFAGALAAGGLALLGLNRMAGQPGFGLGAAALLLLGNPLSGTATAPEFLTPFWSAIGQGMPPGAATQLLRSVSYFDSAAIERPALVLACWAAAGLLLLALPDRRAGNAAHDAEPRHSERVSSIWP